MSDKTVGIIGQKYEDRKTGKCGVLESRDDKYKTLLFRADDGSTFSISNSSFRSNWRKTKEEGVDAEPEVDAVKQEETTQDEISETVEDTPEPEAEEKPKKRKVKSEKKEPAPAKSYEGITDEDAIQKFTDAVGAVRKVEVTTEADAITVRADDVVVVIIKDNEDETFHLAMLPDLFTLADWRGKLYTPSIQYRIGAPDYLGVTVDTKHSCIPEIFDIIEETVKDINLYGYTEDESEE